MKAIVIVMALLFIGCGDEGENMVCETTVECTDDKELTCDEPVTTVFEDGTTLELRSCTYATYENCFERTECKPR
jgi:hypothetical protein